MTRQKMQTAALESARNGQALTNYPAIFSGFIAKGIPETDIKPRDNILTFHAWRALGRSVRKGEHGVKIITFIPCSKTVKDAAGKETEESFRRPWTTTVFHISQTEARP